MTQKKAIRISEHEPIDTLLDAGVLVAPKFAADTNADIVTEGGLILAAKNNLQTKKDNVASLETQLATALSEELLPPPPLWMLTITVLTRQTRCILTTILHSNRWV